jgi:uncharacterized membrane protein
METNMNIKPSAGSAYSRGWQMMKENFISLFLVILITAIVSFPMGIFNDSSKLAIPGLLIVYQAFGLLYLLFLVNPINYGADWVYLKASRKEKFDVKEVFDVFKNYLNVVLAGLLVAAIVGIGIIFIIIPGIVFACRLAFVPFLVMDKQLDPVKAVEESWRLTKGHGWRIFWMAIIGFFLIIGGLIALIFGVFIAFIWIRGAFASLYAAVLEEKGGLTTEVVTIQE